MLVCVEMPRGASGSAGGTLPVVVRAGGLEMRGWAMRLTVEDSWIRGGPVPASNTEVKLDLPGLQGIRALVVRSESAGVSLALAPNEEQRAALITLLHTREGAHGTMNTRFGGLLADLSNRSMR